MDDQRPGFMFLEWCPETFDLANYGQEYHLNCNFAQTRSFWIVFLWHLHCCCCSAQLCPTLYDPMDCSTPGFRVLNPLPEFAQTHVHWVGDGIQPSHPLTPPSPVALSLSQHQSLFKWVSSSYQVVKILELQLQHQSFRWIFKLFLFAINWFDIHAV